MEEDRISELPHYVIARILGLVHVKDAVRTALLSKKWVNYWKMAVFTVFVDDPEFSGGLYGWLEQGTESFPSIVQQYLAGHDGNIESFSFKCHKTYSSNAIFNTIVTALEKEIKKVELAITGGSERCFPRLLFVNQVLVSLKFGSDISYCTVRLPQSIRLERLKDIELTNVTCFHGHGNPVLLNMEVPVLEMEMSVLESLTIIGCKWINVRVINVNAPLLQNLLVKDCLYMDDSGAYINNILMNITAKRVQQIYYCGHLVETINLHGTEAMVQMTIEAYSSDDGDRGIKAWNFLNAGSPWVRMLRLGGDCLRVLGTVANPNIVSFSFSRLHHLVLEGTSFTTEASRALSKMAQRANDLEWLSFEMGIESWDGALLGHLKSLKSLRIIQFQEIKEDEEDGIEFIELILTELSALPELHLQISSDVVMQRIEQKKNDSGSGAKIVWQG